MNEYSYGGTRSALQALVKALIEQQKVDGPALAHSLKLSAHPHNKTARGLCLAMAHTATTGEVTDATKVGPAEPF